MTTQNILKEFDLLEKKGYDEDIVEAALRKLQPQKKEDLNPELLAELMAFHFVEDYEDIQTGWGTYFGPMMVMNNGDGTVTESPSMKLITSQMIDYYERRANECVNPILIARYSGLVYDFKNIICKIKPSYEIAKLYINSLISIANGDYNIREYNVYKKLKRALTLAISINNQELILKTKDALLNYEKRNGDDDKPGLWGYSFDLLIGNKKTLLTVDEEKEIIQELEHKLQRITQVSDTKYLSPSGAEAAANRLAEYYFKNNREKDVKRVIGEVNTAYYKIQKEASSMQVAHWLEKLYRIYLKFNLMAEANDVLIKLRDIGPKMASEMKKIPFEFEIPQEDIKNLTKEILKGTSDSILGTIAGQFVPKKDEAKEELLSISKKSPLAYFFNHQIQDAQGRVIATLKSLEEDMDGHLAQHISQGLAFSSIFLHAIFEKAISENKISSEILVTYLKKTPIIKAERFPLIENSLKAYFEKNYIVFIHLIIPQIEESIRNVIEVSGGTVLKVSRSGGYQLRTLDDILRDPILIKTLGEDFTNYFRILFTDQRGWNLRNNVCHGMISPYAFNKQTADRVLHSLLCIGIIRKQTDIESA